MYSLSPVRFQKARNFIFSHGDAVNQAWFRYWFVNPDADAFLATLASHQFENGGFGGIYYEFDYQGPCLKCTEIAIGYILNMKERPSPDLPIIQNTMRYLLDNYLSGIGNWGEPAVPEINQGIHCPWVRYRGIAFPTIQSENERIRQYEANEKACFAAFVAHYPELVPEEQYAEILRYPIQHIYRHWDRTSPTYNRSIFEEGTPYDFMYFQWLIPCLKDTQTANTLTDILCQEPTSFMELDFAKSDREYVHLPCDVVESPDSPIYPAVKSLVESSLTYRMAQQSKDGRWPLGWSFGNTPAMQALQTRYEAFKTTAMLVKLARFSRIESFENKA